MTDENKKEDDWKKIRLTQNVVRIAACMVALSLTVGAMRLTSNSIRNHFAVKEQTKTTAAKKRQSSLRWKKRQKRRKKRKKSRSRKRIIPFVWTQDMADRMVAPQKGRV